MKKQIDYDEWRLNKIMEIQKSWECAAIEAYIAFLLQDIAYKLSAHYLGTMPKNVPPEGATRINRDKKSK